MLKKSVLVIVALLIVMINITSVFALTARIGNSRMVLRTETGELLRKSILVQNANDEPVTVTLFPSGDLKNFIEIEEEEIYLEADSEHIVYFTIDVVKSGRTESRVNVQFTPEEGYGVGISSNIIVIAEGEDLVDDLGLEEEDTGFFENLFDSEEDETIQEDTGFFENLFDSVDSEEDETTQENNNLEQINETSITKEKISLVVYLTGMTAILVVAFIALVLYNIKVNTVKSVKRTNA